MKIHFKGTRGSIPTAYSANEIKNKVVSALLAARGKELRSEGQIREFVDKKLPFQVGSGWGGNTPCVYVETGSDEKLIFDGGSGLRVLGQEFIKAGISNTTFHVFLSHLHYDHVQGIPFFIPAYDSSNHIVFHGGHQAIENALTSQMAPPFFPIGIDAFKAKISFQLHKPGDEINECDATITLFEQDHPGVSYGYRVESKGKSMVYSTDAEHANDAHKTSYPFIDFIHGANLLIFDAPYTHSQSISIREHWGHSSNIMGVELAARGEVEILAIFHHDPGSSDNEIESLQAHTKKFLQSSRTAIKETRSGIPGAPTTRKFPTEILHSHDGLIIAL